MCADRNRITGKLPAGVKKILCELLGPLLFHVGQLGEQAEFGEGIYILTRPGEACSQQETHVDYDIKEGVCVVFVSLGSDVGWGDGRMNEDIMLRIGSVVVFHAQQPHYGLGYKAGADDLRCLLNVHVTGRSTGSGEQCSTHQFT